MVNLPPVCRAAAEGNLDLLKRLVDRGMSINEVGPRLVTPLRFSVNSRRSEVCFWLINHGAKVNA